MNHPKTKGIVTFYSQDNKNTETTEIGYFGREELPEQLANEKTTAEQILMCFEANGQENWKTILD